MMILTIDAGNSRIKWALWQNHVIVAQGASAYERSQVPVVLQTMLDGLDRPVAVYVVCVAGDTVYQAICEQVSRHWQLPVARLKTQARYRQVRHAYAEPCRHGADRWAAVVAAHYDYPQATLCVIGAGTAITFDFVTPEGRHLGGYILPSLYSMQRALTADTADVVSQPEPDALLQPAEHGIPDNTRDGVNAGLRLLLQAGIGEICRQGLAQTGSRDDVTKAKIIISGGFADVIMAWQEQRPDMPAMTHAPDLVMRGLYRIMTQPDDEFPGAA